MPFGFEDYKGVQVGTETPSGLGGQAIDGNAREFADRVGPILKTTIAELGAASPLATHDSSDTAEFGTKFYDWSKISFTDVGQIFMCIDDTPEAAVWVLISEFDAYGEIYVVGNAVGVSLPTQNVWEKIDSSNTAGLTAFMTSDHANDKLVVTVPGVYEVNYGCSFEDGANNTYERAIAIDAAVQNNSMSKRKLGALDIGDVGRSGLRYDLDVGKEITLMARCTNTGSTTIVPIHMNLNAKLIKLRVGL